MARITVVKVGGKAAERRDSVEALVAEMASLCKTNSFIFVHGGGAEVTRVSKVFGLEAVFVNGVRQTSPDEMEIVDMVLAGKMNKYLVRIFHAKGVRAVGLSGSDGGIFTGTGVSDGSRTGVVTRVDPALLTLLMDAGYLPVLCSTSVDASGGALNVNADEAALAVAGALKAANLVFISDIPGILKNGAVLPEMDASGVDAAIADGTITGGMIPKVTTSLDAIRAGVGRVIIGDYSEGGDLKALLSGSRGSRIV